MSEIQRLYPEWHVAIQDEISEARRQGGHKIRLMSGEERGISGGRYIYQFRADQEVQVPDGCGVEVRVADVIAKESF